MKTIKFSAKTKNGTIVIPKRYQKIIINPVEVTLQYNDDVNTTASKTTRKKMDVDKFFNAYHIDLNGFKFNRDEANEI